MTAAIARSERNDRGEENHETGMKETPIKTSGSGKWTTNIILVLVLTTAIFICQGWLKPGIAQAATTIYTYTFTGSASGWVGVTGTNTTTVYNANTLTTTISGRNKADAGVGWQITGITWETLGVPAGAVVTAVDGSFDWQCSAYTNGAQSSSGALTLTDSADGNLTTLETEVLFTGTTALATRNASGAIAVPAALQASNSSIKIKLLGNMATAAVNGATVTRVSDTISLTITYTADTTAPVVGTVTPQNTDTGSYVDGTFDLTANISEVNTVASCEYCASTSTPCNTWAAGTVGGSAPNWTCTKTGISGFSNGATVYLNIRATDGSSNTGTGTQVSRIVDSVGPAAGSSFTATAGNTTCSLNWAATTDAGGGMDATQPYEVRRDSTSCTTGTQVYLGTGTAAADNGLTNNQAYNYRLCYKDVFGYQSEYATTISCTPVAGPPILNPDLITATGAWVNDDNSTPVDPARLSDTSDATYAKTSTNGATFNATFSNDAAYAGKQVDNVRIYVRASSTGEKVDWGPVISGTPYLSGTQVTLTDILNIQELYKDWATNPATSGNWTPANIDALEAQIKAIATGGMSQENVYKVWAVITYSDPPSSANIVHNSATTGSSKWSPLGWGVTGGRYGAFTCDTCHTESTTNIKRIKSTVITAPSGPAQFPAQAGGVAPVFSKVSGNPADAGVMGDDSTNPRGSSNKICEVCHTYSTTGNGTKYHAYSGGTNDPAHQNNAKDCIGCHKHSEGFKKPACDTCHGNPPIDVAGLANSPNTTGSVTAGAHSKHALALAFGCSNCHNNQNMPQTSTVKPGFGDISIAFSNFGSTTGSYSGQSNVSYNNTLGDGAKTCSTNYCHGSTINPVVNPVWDAAAGAYSCGSVPNGSCHPASAANPPAGGAHTRHALNGTYAGGTKQGLNIACTDCHGSTAGGSGHVNGLVSWSLNTTSNKFSATATYSGQTASTTGGRAPSASFGACNNTYCHSTVTGNGGVAGTYVASPAWNSTTICASCHSDQTTGFTGKHQTHTTAPYSYACTNCHSGAGAETTKHSDRNVDVTIDATYGGTYAGTPAPGDAYSTCSNVYCHGNFSGGLNPLPNWGGTAACGSCHGSDAATPPSTGNHSRHAGNGAGQLGLACAKCHPARAVKDGHVDMSVQWQLATTDGRIGSSATYSGTASGATGTRAPSVAYKNCANVYCHSTVQNNGATAAGTFDPVTWGGGALTCTAACHNQTPSTGSHSLHVVTQGYACAACHNGAGDETALHANQVIDMSIQNGGTYSQGSHTPAPTNTGYGICNNTACHGVNSGTWGANTSNDTCTKCHGVLKIGAVKDEQAPGYNGTGVDTGGATAATDPEVGAHDTHLRGLVSIVSSTMIQCEDCHVYPATVGAAGHFDTYDPPTNSRATVTFTTTAHSFNTGTYAPATYTCSNMYCHGGSMPRGDTSGTNRTPVWNDTAYLTGTKSTDCNRCHGAPPTAGSSAGTHSGKTLADCKTCHPDTVSDTLGTINTAGGKHINGSLEAQSGCTGCHSSGVGTAPDQFRNAVADFTQTARHVFGGTVSDFDCIVCHAEGDTTSSTAGGIKTTTQHNDAGKTIAMRNVDSVGNPGTLGTNFWQWPKPSQAPTNTDYTNMDNFCLACHDANGASGINVKATNDGLNLGTTRQYTPFNTSDGLGSTGTVASEADNTAYELTRVVDIKSKLAASPTNAAFHQNGYATGTGIAYTTQNAGWVVGAWVTKTLKDGTALTTVREAAKLHCADCHTVDTNAHSGANPFMLQGTTVDNTCGLCHNRTTTYSGSATAEANSRFPHASADSNVWAGGSESKINLSQCLNCHGGDPSVDGYGGIHGMPTTPNDKRVAQSRYRFTGGAYMTYRPSSWTAASTSGTCYFTSKAEPFSNCAHHAAGTSSPGYPKGWTGYSRGTPGQY